MSESNYWVTISCEKGRCGAGFLLTRRFVLTAAHCLRSKVCRDDPVTVARGQNIAEGRVVQVDEGQDVALIQIDPPLAWTRLPIGTSRCEKGDYWLSPYRPPSSRSELKGTVLTSPTEFRCSGGATIEGLELEVRQLRGGYRGYSGSPVEREDGKSGPTGRHVVGMLLEQDPHQVNREEATNVLFAVTVQHAMAAFDLLDSPYQLSLLRDKVPPGIDASRSQYFSGAQVAIDEIRRLADVGYLPVGDVADLVREAVREAARRTVRGGTE